MKKRIAFLLGGVLLSAFSTAHAADKPTVEVMTSWTSGGEAAALQVIRDEYEKRGGDWSISSIAGFTAASAAFLNRVVAGDPPSANQVVIGLDPADYISQGLMNPIDDVVEKGHWADVLPKQILDLMTYDGKVYLAPTGAHGESWMFYSKDAFAKAGIEDVPASWDDFFTDMDKLKEKGIVPIAWGGQAWQETKVFNMVLLTQVGLDGFMKIYTEQDDSDASVAGIEKTLEILAKMRGYVDEGAPGRNWNDATAMVITGKAGVQFHGDWAKGEFVQAGMEPGKDYGCALAPASPGMVYIADSFAFPKTGDAAQDAGQKLLAEVLMAPRVQAEFALKKGAIPMRSDVDPETLDVCAQKGLELMSAGKIVPDQAIILTPQQAGSLSDFVDEFWSNPSADPKASAADFYNIF